jgi:hypothetical protein
VLNLSFIEGHLNKIYNLNGSVNICLMRNMYGTLFISSTKLNVSKTGSTGMSVLQVSEMGLYFWNCCLVLCVCVCMCVYVYVSLYVLIVGIVI